MEPVLGRPLDAVRVHDDARAAAIARGNAAQAVTFGNHIYFGAGRYAEQSVGGGRLIAHEVAHVVQQCGGSGGATPMLAAHADVTVDLVAAVKAKLAQPDPIAGVGDPSGAVAVLMAVADDQVLLETLEVLESEFLVDQLLAITPRGSPDEVHRVTAAMKAVKYAHAPQGAVGKSEIEDFVAVLERIPAAPRTRYVRHILDAHGIDQDTLTESLEGADAMRDMNAPSSAASAPIAAATASVQPAPWAPPGSQPIPFYIGDQAHRGIAAAYEAKHKGDAVFTNFTPMSTILRAWTRMGNLAQSGLQQRKLDARPDIANLTRQHLYEIKPANALDLAVREAEAYQRIFARAGVPMTLGPSHHFPARSPTSTVARCSSQSRRPSAKR